MPLASLYHPSIPDEANGADEASILHQLGLGKHDLATLADTIRTGFPVDAVERLATELGIPARRLMKLLALSPATMGRRKLKGKPLTAQESDRLYRIVSVYATAIRLFEGDREAARDWLLRPVRGLGNLVPLEQLDTEPGTEAVLDLIGRIEHGIAV